MKTLNTMTLKSFLPVFLFSLAFFILILQLVDLFGNLWRYLNNDVSLLEILSVSYLYLPKCISFSISPSLLFSISFTLGTFYANNELISIFGSGVSLFRFVLPLIFVGLLFSVGGFFFEEKFVIDTFKQKNELTKTLLKQQVSYSNTNITVLSRQNKVIYQVDYYNDNSVSITGITILFINKDGEFSQRIDAEQGEWNGNAWELKNCRIFQWDTDRQYLTEIYQDTYSSDLIDEPPSTFKKNVRNVEEMRMEEAREWIESLKRAGVPFRGALTEYYKRFSLALTPIVVAFISSALGGKFRKNILLMSLLASLVITVVYYVIQMILVLFAKLGYIPPTMGAWGTIIIFIIPSIWLFKLART